MEFLTDFDQRNENLGSLEEEIPKVALAPLPTTIFFPLPIFPFPTITTPVKPAALQAVVISRSVTVAVLTPPKVVNWVFISAKCTTPVSSPGKQIKH